MAKKAAKTNIASIDGASAAPSLKSTTVASRAKKHVKAQVAGLAAAAETFVHTVAHPVEPEPVVSAATPATPIAQTTAPAEPVSHEAIAKLAFCYYMDRGGVNGSEAEDWLRAEQTLKAGK